MSVLFPPGKALPALDKNACYLVVDDFETMRKVTINQLRQLGAEKIFSAKDGQEALRLIRSQRIDMVLSDWNMPVMSGYDLLKALRSDPHTAGLPFLMVTAEAERHRIEAAIAAGVSGMLIKPYSPNQLAMRVERAMAPKATRSAPRAPAAASVAVQDGAKPSPTSAEGQADKEAPTRERGKPTILCVDDTPENLTLLAGLLQDDYQVRSVKEGHKALQICFSDNPPDLVLLDIMMPEMDGFEVARRMREHPNAETIPVIFVTAMDTDEALQKGLELGAVDFITKPIDPVMLKSRVRNFMRYVELRRNLQYEYDSMVELNQLREDVAHITRHDLKGPLAGLIGIAQGLLQAGNIAQEHLQQIRLLEETALQTLNMVNLSSELFKIETGRFRLQAQPVPIQDILQRCLELARSAFSEKKLDLSCVAHTVAAGQPLTVHGDAMLCYSLFQNLIKNACEAAPPQGQVMVQISGANPVCVEIRNAGAVPADMRERFFEKYASSGKAGGTGLGTYSARLLAQAQNGRILLDVSDAEDRTTVTVELPGSTTVH